MLPMLPSKDSDPTRQEKLFQLQLRYRYVYDWPPGVATAVSGRMGTPVAAKAGRWLAGAGGMSPIFTSARGRGAGCVGFLSGVMTSRTSPASINQVLSSFMALPTVYRVACLHGVNLQRACGLLGPELQAVYR